VGGRRRPEHRLAIDRPELDAVVAGNDKQRFTYDGSGTRIRASQGHSVAVDLGYAPATPPEELFHGTVDRFLPRSSPRACGRDVGTRCT
jgi:putative RNA 2'-phosphotransferase